ncbi:MAG: DNA translocase FtsK [Candidatus Kapabacteria bacterium]|nr:DNA translocase FtsK [Candidatus Kapabacteria bacterium]
MAPRPDHIPLKRRTPTQSDPSPTEDAPRPRQRSLNDEVDRLRRFKIGAALLAVFSLLMLVALISYSRADEANAQLTLRDVMRVIQGDSEIRMKFDQTHNWIGLFGAVLANWMYTACIGLWSALLPVLFMFWAYDLFRYQRITPLVARRSIISVSAFTALASLIASLQLIDGFDFIPREATGAIGQFLAGITTPLVGRFGSILIWLLITAALFVFGFQLNVKSMAETGRDILDGLRMRLSSLLSYIWTKEPDRQPVDGPEEHEEPTLDPDATSEDEEVEELDKPATLRRTSFFSSGNRSIIRPRNLDDEPAAMLRRAKDDDELAPTDEQPPADEPFGQQLSGSVRILRPLKPQPPQPEPPKQRTPTPTPPTPEPPSVDLGEVEKRLQQLHPNKDISLVQRDEDDETESDEIDLDSAPPPSDVVVQRPVPITVQSTLFPIEPEVQLSNVTLYDEEIAYKPPVAGLLVDIPDEGAVDDSELEANARTLQEKLETFRVRIENLTVTPGPVVTQYEFVPASGIKVSQIENLSDDIALALKAQGVRIIAPIPGKGTVGIEIPNQHPAIVRFSAIIKSPKYHDANIKLPLAMGKTVVGEVYCADLTKMPHLLIAGATGKGKSVGINTIIASLLYRMHPRDLKFVIVDPKRVEMNLYASLRDHFLAISPDINESIITSPQNAVIVLKALVEEMQQRFSILAAAGQRNILDYNQRVREGKIKDKGGITHRPIPYIVVIIDELADLMMTASKEVEEPICRLAQLARAVGIHCIVATQRPSVDVVTGLIKANFPARIAYQVSSRIDSRTILDGTGAEHLIGNGDMLFAPGNTPLPIRMQNAFISTDEVEALCEWIGKQHGYSTPYMLPSINKRSGSGGSSGDDRDALFEDAARIFIQLQQASTSTLQRRLKIGYARAARIVDELEMTGIVGPPDGSRGRPVLLQSESELEAYL